MAVTELSSRQRMQSAAAGAVLTSLLVTPLDVVKTRLQLQAPTTAIPSQACKQSASSSACMPVRMTDGIVDYWCHKCQLPLRHTHTLRGPVDTMRKIVRHEGVSRLWRGLQPTLLMSIPSTIVYFNLYDVLRQRFRTADLHAPPPSSSSSSSSSSPSSSSSSPSPSPLSLSSLSPLIAGASARMVSTSLFIPLELIRTLQMAPPPATTTLGNKGGGSDLGILQLMRRERARPGGIRNLWRGAGPTLWRDVPFSGIYFLSYESLMTRFGTSSNSISSSIGVGGNDDGIDEYSSGGGIGGSVDVSEKATAPPSRLFATSFGCGAAAGCIASLFTHPFDVAKTRLQIELYSMQSPPPPSSSVGASSSSPSMRNAMWPVLRRIVVDEGAVGLFAGLSARLTKVAPACAIMISSYEVAKQFYGEANANAAL
jgi:solute carrier family 25 protein 39/40